MNKYIQNDMKKVGTDNVQQYKRDDNDHQHKRKYSLKGRCISKMEMEHLLFGETEMIPGKMHQIKRILSRAELHIMFNRE